jgi:hypothetical protein
MLHLLWLVLTDMNARFQQNAPAEPGIESTRSPKPKKADFSALDGKNFRPAEKK